MNLGRNLRIEELMSFSKRGLENRIIWKNCTSKGTQFPYKFSQLPLSQKNLQFKMSFSLNNLMLNKFL